MRLEFEKNKICNFCDGEGFQKSVLEKALKRHKKTKKFLANKTMHQIMEDLKIPHACPVCHGRGYLEVKTC